MGGEKERGYGGCGGWGGAGEKKDAWAKRVDAEGCRCKKGDT